MKTYTGKQCVGMLVIAGVVIVTYVAGAVVLIRYGERLPGGEWIFVLSCVLVAVAGALLDKVVSNLIPPKGSFVIDEHGQVVAYVQNKEFVNARQLDQKKWRVVRHTLQAIIVDGIHSVRVIGGEKKIAVQSTVWVDVDPSRLQDYFDTFLKASGLPTPEERVRELIDGCEFFRKQDPVAVHTDSSGLATTIVGKQLAEWLKEGLTSSGLRIERVACVATD